MTVVRGSSIGMMWKLVARNVMPTNRIARMLAITISVRAAFRASGGLNAGTPVAIASVPVSATAPAANARSRIRIVTSFAVWVVAAMTSGVGAGPVSPWNTIRNVPAAIIRNAEPRNR